MLKICSGIRSDFCKSKLRGITLPAPWEGVLDQAFGIDDPSVVPATTKKNAVVPQRAIQPVEHMGLPEHHELVIDPEAVKRLAQESERLRARLLAEEELQTTEDAAQVSRASRDIPAVLAASATLNYTERPADAPPGLLTDLPEVAAAMGQANGVGAKLLRILRAHGWQADHRCWKRRLRWVFSARS